MGQRDWMKEWPQDKGHLRRCCKCGEWQNRELHFYKSKRDGRNGYNIFCKLCQVGKQGITFKERNARIKAQPWCMICHTTVGLVLDHCHATGIIRSVSCNGCNTGLGCFKDNPGLLKRAIGYLEFYRERNGR